MTAPVETIGATRSGLGRLIPGANMDTRMMFAAVLSLSLFFACAIFGFALVASKSEHEAGLKAKEELVANFVRIVAPEVKSYDLAALGRSCRIFLSRPDVVRVKMIGRYNDVMVDTELEARNDHAELRTYTSPVFEKGKRIGTAEVIMDNSDIEPNLFDALKLASAAFVICAAFGATILIVYINRFVSRPLRELQMACDETVRTGKHTAARFVSSDRFGEYAHSFNKMQTMLKRLQSQLTALVEEMSDEKDTFDAFLTLGHSAISVFDRNGRLLMRRGTLIDDLLANSEVGINPLADYRHILEERGKKIGDEARGQHYLIEVPSPTNQRITASYSYSLHEISDERTALFAFDITPLRQAELQVAQLQKTTALGELTNGIAHDFNNILFAILGSAEALLEGDDAASLNERQRHLIEYCLKGGRMGTDLTQQLLAYSRRRVLNEALIDLQTTIPEICDFLRQTVGKSYPIALSLRTDCTIFADLSMLQRALMNLVLNARNAMPEGGTISIGVKDCPDDHVEITVTNPGPPIPEHIRERVFDPFFTTRVDGGGSGLGLSMVEGFVSQSGGTCAIRNIEGGVEVSLRFPRRRVCAAQRKVGPATPARVASQRTALNLLLIDDNETVLNTTRMLLESLKHNVTTSLGAADLVDEIEGVAGFDVVIMDVMMPGVDGFDFVEMMRAQGVDVPVILMTGLQYNLVRDRMKGLTRCRIISKPVLLKTLENELDAALGETAEPATPPEG